MPMYIKMQVGMQHLALIQNGHCRNNQTICQMSSTG